MISSFSPAASLVQARTRLSGALRRILPAVVLALLPWLLYFSVLQAWWRWDDPVLLSYALDNDFLRPLFVPDVWQSLTPYNFTPLVFLSLKLDLHLFGADPFFFYARQLLVLSGVCIMSYKLLCRWTTDIWAFFGGVLFCAGPVVMTTVNQLMTRHYLEGLFFLVLAFFLYIRSLDKNSRLTAVAGGAAFFMSLSAKEIFFPLALLILFWPGNTFFSTRIKFGIFYLVPLIAFFLWRAYMLEGALDGYGIDFSLLLEPASFLGKILSALLGGGVFVYSLWIAAALLFIRTCLKKGCVLPAAVIAVSLFAPLLVVAPVVSGPDRFLLLLWWVICTSAAVAVGNIQRGIIAETARIALAILLLTATVSYAQTHKERLDDQAALFESAGRFLWSNHNPCDILYAPRAGSYDWFFWGLADLKKGIKDEHGTIPRVMSDPVEVAEEGHDDNMTVWGYDPEAGKIAEIEDPESQIVAELENLLTDFNFKVDLKYADDVLSWDFDAGTRGDFFIMYRFRENVTGLHPLAPEGTMKMPLGTDLKIRVKFKSDEGFVSYSPWATLRHDEDQNIIWNAGE